MGCGGGSGGGGGVREDLSLNYKGTEGFCVSVAKVGDRGLATLLEMFAASPSTRG